MIYLDNAASTPPMNYLHKFINDDLNLYGNPSSIHKAGVESKRKLEAYRRSILNFLFNTNEGNVIFTSGGTESNNLALFGLSEYLQSINKTTIITSKIEHSSIFNACKALEKRGFKVIYMPVCYDGRVDIEELDKTMQENKDTLGLVSIQMVNSEIGTIQAFNDIGDLCEEYGVLFHTDAVQAVGHIDIDVNKSKISLMSISGHKFHAIKGIGALYVRDTKILKSILYGGEQEFGIRPGTENVLGAGTMCHVLADVCNWLQICKHNEYCKTLQQKFLNVLNETMNIPYQINSDGGIPNIINISIPKVEGTALAMLLNEKGICVSTGSACNSNTLEPSRVLTAIGLPDELALCSIRVSFSFLNTVDELANAAIAIATESQKLYEVSNVQKNKKK